MKFFVGGVGLFALDELEGVGLKVCLWPLPVVEVLRPVAILFAKPFLPAGGEVAGDWESPVVDKLS